MTARERVGVWGLVVWVCAAAMGADVVAQGRRGGGAAPGTVRAAAQPPQTIDNATADPLSGPVVTNAPFSADAVTTVTRVLGDGTRIEETSTARFYRDSAGRVRREQTILGLAPLNPTGESRTVITIDPDPGDSFAYTLDPVARTARRVSRGGAQVSWITRGDQGGLGAANRFYTAGVDNTLVVGGYVTALGISTGGQALQLQTAGVSQPEESLGSRQVEGVTATGRRTRSTIPTGQIGNDRPIEITDERWVSADLRLLVRSIHRDPRNSDVEYRLTNISRAEPPADLFQVPADYTVVQPGAGGGRGGRGQ